MLDVVLACSIVSLAMGAVVITLSLLAYARFSSPSFRYLAGLIVAAVLIMLVDLLKEYDRVSNVDFSGVAGLYAALAGLGGGLFAWAGLSLVFDITRRPVSPRLRAAGILLSLLLCGAGVWRELAPAMAAAAVSLAGLVGVQTLGMVILGTSLSRVENARARQLARGFLFVAPALVLAVLAQAVLSALGRLPAPFDALPVAQVLYLLVMEGLLLYFGVRYLFRPEPAPACLLPDQFVVKYNISPRECEIVSMLVQGYSNRMIAEKLFISAMTVKNHIYHIYQKTSVGNKVKLVNLINSLK